jgi:hypothetical protein
MGDRRVDVPTLRWYVDLRREPPKLLPPAGSTPSEPTTRPLEQWLGLPPHPPTWAWFGPGYARLVPLETGVLYTSFDGWVSPSLMAKPDEVEPARRGAERMPRGVRTPWWRVVLRRPG